MAASCWSLYCYCWLHTHIQINIAGRRRCCCCRWLLQQQKRQAARLLFSNFPTNKKSSWCGDWTPFFCLLVCWKLTNNCLVFHVVVYLRWWNWFLTLGLTPFWPLLLQFRNRVCAHNNFHSKVQLFLWFSTNTRTQPHKTTPTLPTSTHGITQTDSSQTYHWNKLQILPSPFFFFFSFLFAPLQTAKVHFTYSFFLCALPSLASSSLSQTPSLFGPTKCKFPQHAILPLFHKLPTLKSVWKQWKKNKVPP